MNFETIRQVGLNLNYLDLMQFMNTSSDHRQAFTVENSESLYFWETWLSQNAYTILDSIKPLIKHWVKTANVEYLENVVRLDKYPALLVKVGGDFIANEVNTYINNNAKIYDTIIRKGQETYSEEEAKRITSWFNKLIPGESMNNRLNRSNIPKFLTIQMYYEADGIFDFFIKNNISSGLSMEQYQHLLQLAVWLNNSDYFEDILATVKAHHIDINTAIDRRINLHRDELVNKFNILLYDNGAIGFGMYLIDNYYQKDSDSRKQLIETLIKYTLVHGQLSAFSFLSKKYRMISDGALTIAALYKHFQIVENLLSRNYKFVDFVPSNKPEFIPNRQTILGLMRDGISDRGFSLAYVISNILENHIQIAKNADVQFANLDNPEYPIDVALSQINTILDNYDGGTYYKYIEEARQNERNVWGILGKTNHLRAVVLILTRLYYELGVDISQYERIFKMFGQLNDGRSEFMRKLVINNDKELFKFMMRPENRPPHPHLLEGVDWNGLQNIEKLPIHWEIASYKVKDFNAILQALQNNSFETLLELYTVIDNALDYNIPNHHRTFDWNKLIPRRIISNMFPDIEHPVNLMNVLDVSEAVTESKINEIDPQVYQGFIAKISQIRQNLAADQVGGFFDMF